MTHEVEHLATQTSQSMVKSCLDYLDRHMEEIVRLTKVKLIMDRPVERPKKKPITKADQEHIIALKKQGLVHKEIADRTGRPISTVGSVLRRNGHGCWKRKRT